MGCPSGSLEDKNAETNADNGRLACEVSERIKGSIYQGHSCNVFELRIVVAGQLGLEHQLWWLTMASTTNIKSFVLQNSTMDAGHLGLKNQLLLVREHYHWGKNFCASLGQWDSISSWSKHKICGLRWATATHQAGSITQWLICESLPPTQY